MKVIQKKLNKRELYYESYDNYLEYINTVENRNNKHPNGEHTLERNCKRDEANVKDFDEAKSLFLNGWETPLEQIKTQINEEIKMVNSKKVIKHFNDVVGFMPIVPNYIMGLPNCMLNMRNDFKKQKVLHFMIVINRSWGYSVKDIIDKMSKIFARIAILERNGYRCRIEVFGSQSDPHSRNTLIAHSVLIKSENQPMDVKRVCFPLIHPAMQKVFSWGWENSLPLPYYEYHDDWLGKSIQYWNEDQRNEILNAIKEKNDKIILVGMNTDIKKVFGEGV